MSTRHTPPPSLPSTPALPTVPGDVANAMYPSPKRSSSDLPHRFAVPSSAQSLRTVAVHPPHLSASSSSIVSRGENLDGIIQKRREELRRLRELRSSAEAGARSEALLALANRRIRGGENGDQNGYVPSAMKIEYNGTTPAPKRETKMETPSWVSAGSGGDNSTINGGGERLPPENASEPVRGTMGANRVKDALATSTPIDSRREVIHTLKYGADSEGVETSDEISTDGRGIDTTYINGNYSSYPDNDQEEVEIRRKIMSHLSPSSVGGESVSSTTETLLAELRQEKERHRTALDKIRELEVSSSIRSPYLSSPSMLHTKKFLEYLVDAATTEEERETLEDILGHDVGGAVDWVKKADRLRMTVVGALLDQSRDNGIIEEEKGASPNRFNATPSSRHTPSSGSLSSPFPRTPGSSLGAMDIPLLRPHFSEAALSVPPSFESESGIYHIRIPAAHNVGEDNGAVDWDRWGVESGSAYLATVDPSRPETLEVHVAVEVDSSKVTVGSRQGSTILVHWGAEGEKVYDSVGEKMKGTIIYLSSDGSEGDYSLDDIYHEAIYWRNEYCTALIAASRAIHKTSTSVQNSHNGGNRYHESPIRLDAEYSPTDGSASSMILKQLADCQTQTDEFPSPPRLFKANEEMPSPFIETMDHSHVDRDLPQPSMGLPPPRYATPDEVDDEGFNLQYILSLPFRILFYIGKLGWKFIWILARICFVFLVTAIMWTVLSEEEEAVLYWTYALNTAKKAQPEWWTDEL